MEADSPNDLVTMDALLQNIIAVVAIEACVPEDKITPDTKLEDLGMDSLDFVALMNALDLAQNKWQGIVTVSDILKAMRPC